MKTLFQSLRWRLQAWHGLLLLLVIISFTLPAHHLARESQLQRIDRELARLERTLIRALMDAVQGYQPDSGQERVFLPFPDFVRLLTSRPWPLPAAVSAQFQGTEPGHAYFAIRDGGGRTVLQSPNAPAGLEFLPIPATDIAEGARSHGSWRECQRSSSYGLQIVVGRDITPDEQEMQRMASRHLLISFGVWVFGLVGGWWLSGSAIRPIQSISRTASRIAEGNLEERIDIKETDSELGQLSRVLNDTFARLHDAFERQRQFTADASHELRTPISILMAETQRVLKRDRTPEEYREALQTCADTAQRMRRLVEALLLLARQEKPAQPPQEQGCDLSDVLRDAAAQLQPLAEERRLTVRTGLSPARCRMGAEAAGILATNLVANALQHGGNVLASCCQEGDWAVLTVRDDGPGIAAADLPHIFGRFYRADQARTGSSSGHSGLGLAIAKVLVENHGGTLTVESLPGQGACFEARLPAAR